MNSQAIKNNAVKDMTKGNIYWQLITFALPIFISQTFQQLYNTADAFIVGKFLGEDAMGAVTSSGTLIFLLVSFFNGTAMGAGIVISRYFGAGKANNVSRAIHTNIVFGLICGAVLTVVGIIFTPTLLTWMDTAPEILPYAIDYFRWYFIGGIALVMYNICRGIMNALGDSRRPLYYLIASSIINIVLDYLFIGVLKWGVWSAALATGISQFVSVILCLIYLCKKGNIFTIEFNKLRMHKDMLLEIIKNGLPSGVQNSVIAFANVIVLKQINFFGNFATTAYGVHAKIEGFGFLPIVSFNMATTTFVSQNLGAKQYERARKGARFGIFSAVIAAELIGILVYIFAPQLIGFFSDSAEIIAFGVKQARTASLFYCLLALSHAIAAVCRGAGKAFVPMFVMLSIWCALRIAYITLVKHFLGEIGYIYWAYPLTWAISSVIYLIYYNCSDWIHGFDKKTN